MRGGHGARLRAQGAPRVLAAVALAAVLGIVGASAGAAPMPTTTDDDPSPTPSASAPPAPTGTPADVSAQLDAYGPAVVGGGQSLSANLTLTNASPFPVPQVSVSLAVTRQPLHTREQLAEFFDNPALMATRSVAAVAAGTPELDEDDEPLTTGTLAGGKSAPVRVAASASDLALPEGTVGVYGVTVSYKVGSTTEFVDAMAMTWLDAEVAPLPVTTIATITGVPSRVSTLLNGANLDGVTLLVDPTALSAVADHSTLAGHESYVLPATNPDVASLAHAGDTALIEFALEDSRSRAWSDVANQPWLALSGVADTSVVSWGHQHDAVATLFDRSHATRSPDVTDDAGWSHAVTTVTTADNQKVSLVVPDAGLSDLVATYRPADPAGPSRIVAESALIALGGDGERGIVVSPGVDWVVTGEEPSPNLAALMSAPWVVQRTLAEALSQPATGIATLPTTQGVDQDVAVNDVDALAARLHALARLSLTAQIPDSVLIPNGRILLGGVATATRGNVERQTAALDSATRSVDATLASVDIARSSDVNLIATSGEVPITVRNDLAVSSTVTVVMRSTSPNLVVKGRPEVTVPAGGEVTAMIPVEAVSSADVALSVWLVNPDNDPISEPHAFQMRVRADWGNAATAVFTGLLVLVMVGGIIRTIRRGRKDTRTGPVAPAATSPEDEEADLADAGASGDADGETRD